LCSLQYRLIWYLCFTFDILYYYLSRRSMNLLCAQRSSQRLDYQRCMTWICWCSIDAHFQVSAGSMLLFFCVQGLRISHKWISPTNWIIKSPRWKANICWRSIDGHSKNRAVTVLLSLPPINATCTSVINCSDQIPAKLHYLHDHNSLTLCSHRL
jgi:hypothetical protein